MTWRDLRDAVTRDTLIELAIVSATVMGIAASLLVGITALAYVLYLVT